MWEPWLNSIAGEDPINLFIVGFALLALAHLFQLDSGIRRHVRELRRRIVLCPLRRERATVMISTRRLGATRYDAVESCSVLEAAPSFACDRRCLRTRQGPRRERAARHGTCS